MWQAAPFLVLATLLLVVPVHEACLPAQERLVLGNLQIGTSPGLEPVADESLGSWEAATGKSLSHEPGVKPIPVRLERAALPDEKLATAEVLSRGGTVVGCNVTVTTARMTDAALVNTVTHELGHCLGLGHAACGVMSHGGSTDEARVLSPSPAVGGEVLHVSWRVAT